MRDQETADIGVQSALTGHLVFSTLHTNDSASAITRLIDIGVEPFLISSSVIAVIAQRLVRVLCDECKEAYQPPPELLAKINLKADRFFRPTGKVLDDNSNQVDCPQCQGTGYVGRIGVFEMMIMTASLRELLRKKATNKQIKDECRRGGMLYLQENAMQKVVEGVTSIKEVLRASQKRARTSQQ